MQHDHILKKLNFDQMTPSPWSEGGGGGGGGGSAGKRFDTICCICEILQCDMQPLPDHTLKKDFDLLTPSTGSGGGRGVSGQNIYYHAAAFGDSLYFDMHSTMTIF